MRDRLIKLIKNSLNKHIGKSCMLAENITSDLLENGVFVPPCKVGDTVYEVTSNVSSNIQETKVVALMIVPGEKIGIKTDYSFPLTRELGRMVFLTREEAEQVLKGGAE